MKLNTQKIMESHYDVDYMFAGNWHGRYASHNTNGKRRQRRALKNKVRREIMRQFKEELNSF